MSTVLGRITTLDDSPRGPDVKHRIHVKREWLERGGAIEFTLPRNLACAKCDGGGCDTCEGAGALSLRDRDDPPERVRVFLPPTTPMEGHAVALRIPERGARAADADLPRGILVLTVLGAEVSEPGVQRVHPSLKPTAVQAVLPELATEARLGVKWPLVVVVAIVVWVLLLVGLRAIGAF